MATRVVTATPPPCLSDGRWTCETVQRRRDGAWVVGLDPRFSQTEDGEVKFVNTSAVDDRRSVDNGSGVDKAEPQVGMNE